MTQDELKEKLLYEPDTGKFFWKVKPAKRIAIGTEAGYSCGQYSVIRINGVLYYAHRLAVLYMTGKFPEHVVDHDNRDKKDNRWKNLVATTRIQNHRNSKKKKNNSSGFNGVHWETRKNKWAAVITVNYKAKFLGYFDTKEEAAAARKQADIAYGFHQNHGVSL